MLGSRDSSDISESILADNSGEELLEDRESEIDNFGEAAAPLEPYQDEPLASSSEDDDRPNDDEPDIDGIPLQTLQARFEGRESTDVW